MQKRSSVSNPKVNFRKLNYRELVARTQGVNSASSKLCPAHFRHVETAISDFLRSGELHFDTIHEV